MANRFNEIVRLAQDTFDRVSSSPGDWVDYLKTAARNYRYSFKDQLLLYAQRPDARACASIELWNNRMHCWVNRGAKGIALIDDSSPRPKLKYVFDVSDVHRSKYNGVLPKLWEMKDGYEEEVIKRLESIYGKTNDRKPFADRLIDISRKIAEEYTPDILQDLMEVKESSYMSGLDELNVQIRLRETLAASIAYSLLSRCDQDPDAYLGDLNFEYFTDFNSPETLTILGTATTDMCEPVLMEIGRTIEAIERRTELENSKNLEQQIDDTFKHEITSKAVLEKENDTQIIEKEKSSDKGLENISEPRYNALTRESETKDVQLSDNREMDENKPSVKPDEEVFTNVTNENEYNNEIGGSAYGTDIQTGRGLSDTRSGTSRGGDGDTDKVWDAETDISEGTPQRNLQRETSDGNTHGTLPYDSEAGRGESREDNRTSDEGRRSERRTESQRPDGMGSQTELYSEQSRRNSSSGDRLQPLEDNPPLQTELTATVKYEQLSLFPLIEEQIGTITAAEAEMNIKAPAAFSLSDEYIAEILKTGSGQKDSRERIFEKYKENHSHEYMAEFLKNEYRTGGKGFEINGNDISVWFSKEGINFGLGKSALSDPFLKLSWDEVEDRVSNIIENGDYLSGNEAYIADQVYRKELADNIYFFFRDAIQEEPKTFELKNVNYPDTTEYLREMLSTPEGAAVIRDEILDRVDALSRGEIEQHWRLTPTPTELADKISGYAGEKRELPTKDTVEVLQESFITQDEIDSVLAGGSGFSGGKFRIYDYVMEGHDRKELADFLKKEYGTGGRTSAISGSWHSYEDYDAKGIQLQKGNIMSPYATVLLNWKVVAKRIEQLVFEGKYLSPEQKQEHDRRKLEEAQKELENENKVNESENLSDAERDTDESLEKAKEIVNDYCLDEFDHGADFSDLGNVELAYTEITDEETGVEHTVQVSADLKSFSINTFVDDRKVDAEEYDSLDALIEYELNYLDFDSLTSLPEDVWDKVREESININNNIQDTAANENVAETQENESEWSEDAIESHDFADEIRESADEVSIVDENFTVSEVSEMDDETSGRKVQKLEENEKSDIPAVNFHITDNNLGEGTPKEKFQRNILAINTLQKLESENRNATPEEQEILSRYVGWGGLSDAFDETKSNWSAEYNQLKNLLSPEEYTSARESTLNAHYTSPDIIRGIYSTLERFGFEKGNILEPSMGVGNFFGMLPESMENSRLYGVELDSISGRIAKKLYPDADIQIKGFEKTAYPNDFFDIAIGNVPFGQYKVQDKEYDKHNFLIHDYFFAKTLDKVRPGGVIAFVTSKGTMDKVNESVRKYLAERAELLGAVRLPNTAFKANAGTEVTSDILIFKKRDRLVKEEPEWLHTKLNADGIQMNAYFADHPEQIVGHMEMISGPFGMESACLPNENTGKTFAEQLDEALSNIEGTIDLPEVSLDDMENELEDRTIPADPSVKNFSYTIIDNELYYRENSVMKPVDMAESKLDRIKGMVGIRDCTRELIDMQLEEAADADISSKQQELNELYDSFEKKFGRINSRTNKSAFSQDSSYSLLASLERFDADGNFLAKADMFTKRTIKRAEVVTSVDTASEALAVSLSEKAKVDIPYMSKLTGKNEEDITNELAGVIFKNPATDRWESADEYLSGNIREKLRIAENISEAVPEYSINVQALKKVMPKDLDASEIEVRIGATWIDPEYYEQFMKETFKTPEYLTNSRWSQSIVGVQYSDITGQWNIRGKNADRNNPLANATYGTERANAYKILEDSLNLKDCRIFDTIIEDGKEKRVLNKKETTLASQKQEALREAFKDWVFADPERRETLVRKYNELFNSTRPREYDGSHLKFPGMSPEITLRPHQKNAVAHQLYGNNTLLAHCVGAGKTWEMAAAAMESKRLGLCRKSLFVVPNHLTEQWGSDFLQLYPGANILVATKKDFEPANRKKFCSRIATGDYDAVIIGHTQFEKIPLSTERQAATIEAQINEIEEAIALAKAERGERYTIKEMEKSRKALKVRLEKLNDTSRKDDVVTFEQLGVDRLFVDESHNYKNLFLYTKMRNVAGIAQTDAQKSSDMFAKCQYMDEITGGKGITFATGTPISNSMTELYTNMRYLQYNTLKKMKLTQFDAWASSFGETQTAIELAPEGTGYRAKTRFAKFFNLPELIALFKESADIKTPDMLKLDVPDAVFENVVLKPSEEQKEMVKALADRAEIVRNGGVDASVDNMLKITNDGRKLALDQRLISDMLPENANSKASACVEKAFEIYQEETPNKGAQLIFCDLSTPKGDGSFSVYEDIRDKLIAKGVPPEEIAFIHSANTETKKADLFAKVRSGQVRFLLGSTQKMGAGTNVQDRLIALHHLDVPWRPSDIEQQEGRIIRQGNMYKELGKPVKIFRYVTEGTFDSYSWQVIENKQKFIGQIMTSKSPVRSCEDVDEAALTYAEVKALCTGNPYIKEKMDLDIQVSKLKLLKANHTSQKYRLEDDISKNYPRRIADLKGRIQGYEIDIEHLKESKAELAERVKSVEAEQISLQETEQVSIPEIRKNDEKGEKSEILEKKDEVKEPFEIQIASKTYTERKEAGAALIDMCKGMKSFHDSLQAGEYHGFKLSVSFDAFEKKFDLAIKGAMTYHMDIGSDSVGNMTRLNNVLSGIESKLEKAKEQLANTETQLETAKVEVTKPFKQEEELAQKLDRLNELNALLNMDETGAEKDEVLEEKTEDVCKEHTNDNSEKSEVTSIFERIADKKNVIEAKEKNDINNISISDKKKQQAIG